MRCYVGGINNCNQAEPGACQKSRSRKSEPKVHFRFGLEPGPQEPTFSFWEGGSLIDVRQSCLKLKEKTNAWRDLVLRTLHRRSPLDLILTALGPNKQYS